jgi:hypothetical protein
MWLRIRSIWAAGPRIDGARLHGVFGRDAGEVPQDEVARLRVLAGHDPIVDRRADHECVLEDVLQCGAVLDGFDERAAAEQQTDT